jgi:hypothetical protein
MRHHTAVYVELDSGKGWHYATLKRDKGGYPLGNCAEHPPHETEDDARRCYQDYRREQVEADGGNWSWGNCDVKGCKNPANKGWRIRGDGYALAMLCDEHNDREHATTALHLDEELAGDAWVS